MLGVQSCASVLMTALHEPFEGDAFDAHVLAHGVKLSLVQACCERTESKVDLGGEAVALLRYLSRRKTSRGKEETHEPECWGELDVRSVLRHGTDLSEHLKLVEILVKLRDHTAVKF